MATCAPKAAGSSSRATDAFYYMAQARHIGKIVLSRQDPEARIVPGARPLVRSDATYLITGGNAGLGFRMAQELFAQGARSLLLVGRSAPSAEVQQSIAAMREQGARIEARQVDVSSAEQMRVLLSELGTDAQWPALRGIAHCAVVLDDHTLLELKAAHLRSVFDPKVQGGSWA